MIKDLKAYQTAWEDILKKQYDCSETFALLYKPLEPPPDPEVSRHAPAETPQQYLQKCLGLQKEYSDEKTDLAQEVAMIGTKLLRPVESAKQHTKLLHKTLKHRENTKLDYERYLGRVQHTQKKQNRTAKDEAALAQQEANLAQAQIDYETADDQVKQTFPPVSAAVLTLLPALLASQIQLQTTLVGQLYTVLDGYTRKYGMPNPAPKNEEIISAWDAEFTSFRREVESGLNLVARGRAVHLSMQLPAEKDKSTVTGLGIRNKTVGAFGKKETPLPVRPGRQVSEESQQQQAIDYEEPAPAKPPRPGAPANPHAMPSPSVNMSSKPRIPSTASIQSASNGASGYPNHPPPPYPTSGSTPGVGSSYGFDNKSASGGATPPSRYQTPTNGLATPLSLQRTVSNTSNNDYFGQPAPLNVRKASNTASTSPMPSLSRLPSNTSIASSAASIAAAKKKPPPPVPAKRIGSQSQTQYVIALFDFEGQGPGDLVFREGDRIRVVKKTESVDDWWDGELGGRMGVFPANYVKMA